MKCCARDRYWACKPIISPQNRAARLKVLLCAMALGLTVVVKAQPFSSFVLDTTVVIGPDPDDAQWTSVAFGSQRGLVVWTDGDLVKGCRFTRELIPLDTPALALSRVSSSNVSEVDVASSLDTFLTVWAGDGGFGPVTAGALVTESDIDARRVTLDSSAMCHSVPVVAGNGTGFLVAWSESDPSGDDPDRTRYARVSRSGALLDTAVRLVADHRGQQYRPDVVWGDTSFMVVWVGWSDGDTGIFCNIIRADGSRASDGGYLISRGSSTGAPVVSFDGRGFIVMWDRYVSKLLAPEGEFRVVRVTSEGAITDSARVTVDQGQTDYRWHALSSIGDTTLLVWESWRDSAWWTYGVRLNSALRTLDSAPIAMSPPVVGEQDMAPAGISCVAMGDTFVASWAGWTGPPDWHTPGRDVVCRQITPEGAFPETTTVMISHAASKQYEPDVASDGSGFMAVWQELRSGSTLYEQGVYCTRFDCAGAVLDSAPIYLDGPDAMQPVIGHGCGHYLVVWRSGARILANRIQDNGVLVDTVPTVVDTGGYAEADVGFVDSTFLIAMQRGFPPHIYGSRISTTGVLLDSAPFVFPPAVGVRRLPGVASDGDSTFIVTRYHEGSNSDDASFMRCTAGGVILESTEVVLGDVPGTFHDVYVSPVRGPDHYFIVATSSVAPSVAWRVSYDGAALDTIYGLYPFAPGTKPVYDGIDYVLAGAWADGGNAIGIGAQLVKPDGTVVNSEPAMVVQLDSTRSRYRSRFARLATNDEGTAAVVFTAFEQQRYGSSRVRGAVWPPLGIEEASATPRVPAFTVQPNPVSGTAVLELGSRVRSPTRVSLYDVQGRIVKVLADATPRVGPIRIPVDVGDLPSGVYLIAVHPSGNRAKLVVTAK